MRLFLFSLLVSTNMAIAADCTEADSPFPLPCDNLYINGPVDLSSEAGPIVINVTGVVEINDDITLDGSPGGNITATNSGGDGGPSAGAGGGIDGFGAPADAEDPFPGSGTANGKAAINDFVCGNGGGGGALFTAGDDGTLCPTSATPVGAGGAPAPAAEFDFVIGSFRGGYGGGSGGTAPATEVGSGGGGGGALRIIAGGDILISSNATISARGGDGGDATTDGGGGGAGSGGALWIQSTAGVITNLGTIDLRGGTGGRNNATGGHGGNGGDGVYQFEDLNGTTNGSGLVLPPTSTGGSNGGSSSSKLSSDISCGTLSKTSEKDHNNLFMIFAGFSFVSLISFLSRFRKYQSLLTIY